MTHPTLTPRKCAILTNAGNLMCEALRHRSIHPSDLEYMYRNNIEVLDGCLERDGKHIGHAICAFDSMRSMMAQY